MFSDRDRCHYCGYNYGLVVVNMRTGNTIYKTDVVNNFLGCFEIAFGHFLQWQTFLPPDTIHCLHDFAHKQDSQLNSSVLITMWRVVIEVWQDSQLNSSAFSHCSVWRVAIGKGVFPVVSLYFIKKSRIPRVLPAGNFKTLLFLFFSVRRYPNYC